MFAQGWRREAQNVRDKSACKSEEEQDVSQRRGEISYVPLLGILGTTAMDAGRKVHLGKDPLFSLHSARFRTNFSPFSAGRVAVHKQQLAEKFLSPTSSLAGNPLEEAAITGHARARSIAGFTAKGCDDTASTGRHGCANLPIAPGTEPPDKVVYFDL